MEGQYISFLQKMGLLFVIEKLHNSPPPHQPPTRKSYRKSREVGTYVYPKREKPKQWLNMPQTLMPGCVYGRGGGGGAIMMPAYTEVPLRNLHFNPIVLLNIC